MSSGRRAPRVRYPALKWALERECIKLDTAAKVCGMTAGMFSYRLNGYNPGCDFSVQDALKLAEFFGTPIDKLFWEDGEWKKWRDKNGERADKQRAQAHEHNREDDGAHPGAVGQPGSTENEAC